MTVFIRFCVFDLLKVKDVELQSINIKENMQDWQILKRLLEEGCSANCTTCFDMSNDIHMVWESFESKLQCNLMKSAVICNIAVYLGKKRVQGLDIVLIKIFFSCRQLKLSIIYHAFQVLSGMTMR